jgi:hypothetical protein
MSVGDEIGELGDATWMKSPSSGPLNIFSLKLIWRFENFTRRDGLRIILQT